MHKENCGKAHGINQHLVLQWDVFEKCFHMQGEGKVCVIGFGKLCHVSFAAKVRERSFFVLWYEQVMITAHYIRLMNISRNSVTFWRVLKVFERQICGFQRYSLCLDGWCMWRRFRQRRVQWKRSRIDVVLFGKKMGRMEANRIHYVSNLFKSDWWYCEQYFLSSTCFGLGLWVHLISWKFSSCFKKYERFFLFSLKYVRMPWCTGDCIALWMSES